MKLSGALVLMRSSLWDSVGGTLVGRVESLTRVGKVSFSSSAKAGSGSRAHELDEESQRVRVTPFEIEALDGLKLGATLYTPTEEAARKDADVVVISPATAVKRGYYHKFARYLSGRRGHRVVSFDYRGTGDSIPKHHKRSLRGFEASMSQWGSLDLESVLQHTHANLLPEHRATSPSSRLLLVGHSVAGQILPLSDSALSKVDAALLVASQSGYRGHWQGLDKLKLIAFWHLVIPAVTPLLGHLPGFILGSEAIPKGVAQEWARWGRHPDYILSHREDMRQRFQAFQRPIRLITFEDDSFCTHAAGATLLSWYGTPENHKSHQHLKPKELGVDSVGHFGFFKNKFQDSLWQPAIEWLDSTATRPQPSTKS